ncbi:MAG: hypothetical protein SGI92_30205 [Bryobacteraceae bacterium]|nr:hypothetical protein [Bryobacteraceae bacterium]
MSPDGRFLVFDAKLWNSPASVYARSLPNSGSRWQISPADGEEPHFSLDGKQVYFYKGGALWAVPVSTAGGRMEAGVAKQLFKIELPRLLRNRIVVMPDGRLLINALTPAAARDPVAVVINWRRLVDR